MFDRSLVDDSSIERFYLVTFRTFFNLTQHFSKFWILELWWNLYQIIYYQNKLFWNTSWLKKVNKEKNRKSILGYNRLPRPPSSPPKKINIWFYIGKWWIWWGEMLVHWLKLHIIKNQIQELLSTHFFFFFTMFKILEFIIYLRECKKI